MENIENSQNNAQENFPVPKVYIEPGFHDFIPEEFIADPVGYFDREGKNIKTGEKKVDQSGMLREDPTAVKDLPTWKNTEGAEIQTVGRRVNAAKGSVGKSGDPFYEYKILEHIARMGLPAAKPIVKAEQAGTHIIIMERIPGIRWSEVKNLNLRDKGYSDEDIDKLITEAEQKMNDLKNQFDAAGVIRGWKLKDMVFQVDVENKSIISIVPTDWERTKIVEKEKPPFLYHGTTDDSIVEFEPRGAEERSDEDPAVYASPDFEIAAQSMANKFVSNGGILNGRKFVCIPMSREEFMQQDRGGIIYKLPSDSFDMNYGKGFGGNKEWISKTAVKPVSHEKFPSLLQKMLEQGTEVYFIQPEMISVITKAQDNPQELEAILASLQPKI
jgi:hypothetical protein